MFARFFQGIGVWFQSLIAFLIDKWQNMTPDMYGIILLCVAAIGYVMMKSGAKYS